MFRWFAEHPLMRSLRTSASSSFGVFALRLALGAIFVFHGWPKLVSPGNFVGFFGKIGIPAPEFFVPFVGFVEAVGGACLILGLLTRFWAAGLVIDMAVAILAAIGLAAFANYEFELALLAASALLYFHGAGGWSLDAGILKRVRASRNA